MCPVAYYTMIRSKQKNFDLRLHLVRHVMEHGIRDVVRIFRCSRNTVRKWWRRYNKEGLKGLEEKSRAPKTCPHKTPPDIEKKVIAQRLRTPGFGAKRLKREFELSPSAGAISRIIRQNGLTRARKKKHVTKKDLRAVKAKYPPLQHFQMDVKYLNDIPNYWPFMTQLKLPRYQYTTRCVKTGATFLTYGQEISTTYAELTARRLLEHLRKYGTDLKNVVIQTDAGSEFDGQAVKKTDRGYTYTIEQKFKAHHAMLRRHNPNANADVESFHSHEETEFFDIEHFKSHKDFWEKIITYQNYWNLARPNSYKYDKTPLQILKESNPTLPPEILLLNPIPVELLLDSKTGHDVPGLTVICMGGKQR